MERVDSYSPRLCKKQLEIDPEVDLRLIYVTFNFYKLKKRLRLLKYFLSSVVFFFKALTPKPEGD